MNGGFKIFEFVMVKELWSIIFSNKWQNSTPSAQDFSQAHALACEIDEKYITVLITFCLNRGIKRNHSWFSTRWLWSSSRRAISHWCNGQGSRCQRSCWWPTRTCKKYSRDRRAYCVTWPRSCHLRRFELFYRSDHGIGSHSASLNFKQLPKETGKKKQTFESLFFESSENKSITVWKL